MAEMTVGQAQRKDGFTHSPPSIDFIFILSSLKTNSCFIFSFTLSLEDGTGLMDNSNCFKYPRKNI